MIYNFVLIKIKIQKNLEIYNDKKKKKNVMKKSYTCNNS